MSKELPTQQELQQAIKPHLQIYRETGGEDRPLVQYILDLLKYYTDTTEGP